MNSEEGWDKPKRGIWGAKTKGGGCTSPLQGFQGEDDGAAKKESHEKGQKPKRQRASTGGVKRGKERVLATEAREPAKCCGEKRWILSAGKEKLTLGKAGHKKLPALRRSLTGLD